jgi:hypothetical protein
MKNDYILMTAIILRCLNVSSAHNILSLKEEMII